MVQGRLNLKVAGKVSFSPDWDGKKLEYLNNMTSFLIARGTNSKNVRGIEISNHFSHIEED